MLKKFKEIFGKTGRIFRQFPMVLLMSFLGAVAFICTTDVNYSLNRGDFVFIKFGLVACLGISLMFGLKILSQRLGKGILFDVFGVCFLIFFYLLLPDQEKHFTEQYAFLLIPTFILSHLLVSFIGFFGEKKELNFWQYNKNLFINIFLTAIFTGVLIGGVELAILAVDKLFNFNFDGNYFTRTFYFLSIFGSCFIFLLFSEKGLQELERDSAYPQILKFFTQYILIPLLLIYALILYLYAAKILINWELPRGWVSYLVLAYSVVGILGLLLVHPLKDNSSKSWVKVFSKMFYYTLIPLIILLFTAIFTRILQYGYTEPRYFVLLLALWLSSVVFYFVFAKKTTIKFIPVTLFAFGLFSLIFPYLNTFSVAKRSQKTELQKVLNENKLLEKGNINFNRKVSDTVVQEVADKFKFLAQRNQSQFLLQFLRENDRKQFLKSTAQGDFWKAGADIKNKFTNIESTKRSLGESRLQLTSKTKIHSIEGYDYLVSVQNYDQTEIIFNGEKLEIETQQNNENLLLIRLNNEQWNVSPFIHQTLKKYAGQHGDIEVREISTERDFGKYRFKIVFGNLTKENVQVGGVYFNSAYLLIKKK